MFFFALEKFSINLQIEAYNTINDLLTNTISISSKAAMNVWKKNLTILKEHIRRPFAEDLSLESFEEKRTFEVSLDKLNKQKLHKNSSINTKNTSNNNNSNNHLNSSYSGLRYGYEYGSYYPNYNYNHLYQPNPIYPYIPNSQFHNVYYNNPPLMNPHELKYNTTQYVNIPMPMHSNMSINNNQMLYSPSTSSNYVNISSKSIQSSGVPTMNNKEMYFSMNNQKANEENQRTKSRFFDLEK